MIGILLQYPVVLYISPFHALSDSNKGEIHKTFASNPNWEYDWRPYVVIDDTNFQVAVNLWFDNQAEANATYGHIGDWNTSAVTNMWAAFDGAPYLMRISVDGMLVMLRI